MGYRQVKSSRVLRGAGASTSELYNLFTDVTKVVAWNAGVKSVDVLSNHTTGVGAVRRCHLLDGTTVKEEVIFVEKRDNAEGGGVVVKIKISEHSLPLQHFELVFKLAPQQHVDAPCTEVVCKMRYIMKWGWFGNLLHLLFGMNRALSMTCDNVLKGIAHYLQTGEYVGGDNAGLVDLSDEPDKRSDVVAGAGDVTGVSNSKSTAASRT